MHKTTLLLLLVVLSFPTQASEAYFVEKLSSGYIGCPETYRQDINTQALLYCEVSAAVFSTRQNSMYNATDWWSKSSNRSLFLSSIRYIGYPDISGRPLQEGSILTEIKKIESMTKTPDNRYTFASTAFTHSPDSYELWDGINKLVYWPSSNHLKARYPSLEVDGDIVSADDLDSKEYSKYLREGLLKAIRTKYPDVSFFKIEGMAILPGNKLALGIRELGTDSDNISYKALILSTRFIEENGLVTIDTAFDIDIDFDLLALRKQFNIKEDIGLSSMEYDYGKNRFYIMTSYEESKTDVGLGAYLWVSSVDFSGQITGLNPVFERQKRLYHFAHKGEALAISPAGKIVLVADDDKVLGRKPENVINPDTQFSRKYYQAAYQVLQLVPYRDR